MIHKFMHLFRCLVEVNSANYPTYISRAFFKLWFIATKYQTLWIMPIFWDYGFYLTLIT